MAAGVGTALFLRNSLIDGVEAQLLTLGGSEAAAPLLEFSSVDGLLVVEEKDNTGSDYFVAVYEPKQPEDNLLALVGGRGGPSPDVPSTLTPETAVTDDGKIEPLTSSDGEVEFLSTVSIQQSEDTGILYPQLVALPLGSVNRTIAQYIGIYSILALVVLIAGAVATRFLVTLTFRSLGQVESTADAIAGGDFSLRMTDIEPTTTEVGRLKTAINAMLDRVDAALSQRDSTVRQMRRFVGDASHELRTPLVTVRGYAELYRMGAIRGDEDVAQSMERIEKEAIRMGVLVEDLLALARLDERRDVVIGPVDLRPIARDAALDVRAASPMRPVTVIDTTIGEPALPPEDEASVPPETKRRAGGPSAMSRAGATLSLLRRRPKPVPAAGAAASAALPTILPDAEPEPSADGLLPVVLGDENRIRQVVTNLLGNARRYSSDESPVELRIGVDVRDRMGWIEVIDHGEGVPDQIKDKIFQRFWRADTSRTRETGGSGLGLSIVASIVEALHGSVGVFDTPGGGATFRVAFPLADARDAAEHVDLATQPMARLTDASE
ncbi:HAMP domain-containing sensor histidine kinase [Microbacterium sp. PRC9]|nr:HAMP domain-containing sensor histidine kinase [Microbacterium sp. PRC9]MDT0141905.1 HAMP domain-containing sensor histidine kinase [Microbacterium sp. PRC9]